MDDYNPYALIPMRVNGTEIFGRPIEFDSEVADIQSLKNGFGNIIKPTKVSTVCPDCGQGLMLDVQLGDPPFEVLEMNCSYCKPYTAPKNPFVNPITSGRVTQQELDPLLHNPRQKVADDGLTVAQRLAAQPPVVQTEPSVTVEDVPASKPAKRPKVQRKPPKKAGKPTERVTPLPPAVGISEGLDEIAEPD